MIEKLTPEQEAALEPHRQKWLEIGTSTERADRPRAEAAVREICGFAEFPIPTQTVWVESPFEGANEAAKLEYGPKATRDQRAQMVHRAAYGQQEAPWIAFYTFFQEHCGVTLPEELGAWSNLAQSAGWAWVVNDTAIITERPTVIHLDQQGQLHCEDGPAMAWADGFEIFQWHGVTVPKSLIMEGWGPKEIMAETNAEVRRCAIEKLGWDRFVEDAHMRLIASAPDPGNAPYNVELYELPSELEGTFEEPAKILLCTNGTVERDGTRRRFGLPVPDHHTDPIAAAAELYGWTKEEYLGMEVRR